MNEFKNEKPTVSRNEQLISETTMSKNLVELKQEEEMLSAAVENLTEELAKADPSNFELFKTINGKLRANKSILEEVQLAIKIKNREEKDAEMSDFDKALIATGEYQEANRLDSRRKDSK
ncbi:MAG: hypothetical protein WCT07_01240 [Candidatus Paceibacterota bacterium]|jgi:hypothetical protein